MATHRVLDSSGLNRITQPPLYATNTQGTPPFFIWPSTTLGYVSKEGKKGRYEEEPDTSYKYLSDGLTHALCITGNGAGRQEALSLRRRLLFARHFGKEYGHCHLWFHRN